MSQRYIVVFKKDASSDVISQQAEEVGKAGGTVHNKFDSIVMKGFSANIPESYLTQLQSLTGGVIDYIEPDGEVKTQ